MKHSTGYFIEAIINFCLAMALFIVMVVCWSGLPVGIIILDIFLIVMNIVNCIYQFIQGCECKEQEERYGR